MSAGLTGLEGAALLALARAAIVDRLLRGEVLARERERASRLAALDAARGCFVTLHAAAGGEAPRLRGCIGTVSPRFPVRRAVVEAALGAAFDDPRFGPVTSGELAGLTIAVSVLTPPAPIDSADAIVVGTHGVVLEAGGRHAIFLPEVAREQGWSIATLLTELARKAGLPPEAVGRARLSVFMSERFQERSPGAS